MVGADLRWQHGVFDLLIWRHALLPSPYELFSAYRLQFVELSRFSPKLLIPIAPDFPPASWRAAPSPPDVYWGHPLWGKLQQILNLAFCFSFLCLFSVFLFWLFFFCLLVWFFFFSLTVEIGPIPLLSTWRFCCSVRRWRWMTNNHHPLG